MPHPLLLIGPSTRAMAYSAKRAGYDPLCVDLFADTDLQAIAPVELIHMSDYPHGFVEKLKKYPANIPVLYTGGLENHPAVYLELSKQRPVWGYLHSTPQHGNSIRNPEYLDSIAKSHAIRRPLHQWPCGFSGRRLVKPRLGAGGRGIRFWDGNPVPNTHYLEQYLDGLSLSVAFVHMGNTTRLLGITHQLIGCDFLHAPSPFTYCGNTTQKMWQASAVPCSPLQAIETSTTDSRGQMSTSPPCHDLRELQRIATTLTDADPYLTGLFGIDFILHDGRYYLLEVNPRYTASVELLEHTTGLAFLDLHCQAFNQLNKCPVAQTFLSVPAKAIYFAPHRLTFPHDGPWTTHHANDPWTMPLYADIPAPGTSIEQGHPVLTFFAQGKDTDDALTQMQTRALELDELFRN